MAKNDNLTDFLRGLADKLRALLDTAEPLNPQEFEEKIQGVYDKGFSQGGPTGITATAADVLSGKVFGSGGSAKATGTMPSRASVSTASAVTYDGVRVTGRFPYGYYPNYDSSGAALYLPNANVASAIGLTAAKIVNGNTILGIAGSAPDSDILAIAVTNITENGYPKYTYYVPQNDYIAVDKGNLGVTGDSFNSAPNGSLKTKKAFTAKVVVVGKFTGDFFHRLWISSGSSGGSTFDCEVNGGQKTVIASRKFSAGQYVFIQAGNGINAGAIIFMKP